MNLKSRQFAALLVLGLPVSAHAAVTISGVDGAMLENVQVYLDIDDLDCDAAPSTLDRAFESIADDTAEALRPFGYYATAVESDIRRDDECWQANIAISPGEPVRVRELDIRLLGPAASQDDFQPLTTRESLAPDLPLLHGEYDALKRSLLDRARNRGYVEAEFSSNRIDIYPDEFAADISLHFEPGPRYTIGEVTLNQDALDPEFVAAYYTLESGQPFDNRLLSRSFIDLNDSGYFSSVDVRALPANADTQEIPVVIDLAPVARRLITYGIGFSTDTGPRFRFGRTNRRFNSRGHRVSIEGQLSPVVSELASIYRMPLNDPRYEWLSFSLGAKREETDTSLARSIEAGIRRVIDRSGGWSRTQYLNYIVEDFEVASQSGRPHLLVPGVEWTRMRGDDALRPSNGSKLLFELRGASDQVLSDSSFWQMTTSIKWIKTVSESGRVLLRSTAGYMHEDNFARLPPSIRFFAGGDNSIRGFDFESLGPVDLNGEVIGGSRLIEMSAEYEHSVRPRWSVAVFADSGNAFSGSDLDWRSGAGIGARWRSPLGPVRIDVAWPVDDVQQGARLHVSLGPDL